MGKVILIALLIVFLVRCFLIESYTVSSSGMETVLLNGDRVLVDKTAYGVRMPVTLLTIPFTFDSFAGMKSYSDAVLLPYKRVLETKVGIGDIVLYNNPVETDRPLDKRSLILNRCAALPGDSIAIEDSTMYYRFAVPRKGMEVELTENNLNLYRNVILMEQEGRAKIENSNLYIDGQMQPVYIFSENYYWMLSDNAQDAADSRSLGFIPMPNIIGKARFVWFSSEDGNVRWNRCFSTVNTDRKRK